MKRTIAIITAAVVLAALICTVVSLVRKSRIALLVDDEYNEDIRSIYGGEVDGFNTKKGKLYIFSIKHGTLAIRYGSRWIYVDPVGKGAQPETDFSLLPKADLILFTHSHGDHLDPAAVSMLAHEGTIIAADPESAARLSGATALENGASCNAGDRWRVDAVPAYNISEGRTNFHPKGKGNGYVITIDGFSIYVAGDTENIPELSNLKGIDVAFLPCNLPYTMTPEQCAEAAKAFSPKVLFPYHYGNTETGRLAELLEGSGIDVRIRSYR